MVFRNNSESVSANAYYFYRGESFGAYEFLACHRVRDGDIGICYSFMTYERDALAVELVGDFNDSLPIPMKKIGDGGLYNALFESQLALEGCSYRYRVLLKSGEYITRHDPYALHSFDSKTAFSEISSDVSFDWNDKKYLAARKNRFASNKNVNISVCDFHISRTTEGQNENYRELGNRLSVYAVQNAYTHVKLCGARRAITCGGFDGCFGVNSEFGSADDFCAFVDKLHAVNVGVIVDVLASAEHEKIRIDGASISLLISSVRFYLRELHVDGVCVDLDVFDGNDSVKQKLFYLLEGTILSEVPDALILSRKKHDG